MRKELTRCEEQKKNGYTDHCFVVLAPYEIAAVSLFEGYSVSLKQRNKNERREHQRPSLITVSSSHSAEFGDYELVGDEDKVFNSADYIIQTFKRSLLLKK